MGEIWIFKSVCNIRYIWSFFISRQYLGFVMLRLGGKTVNQIGILLSFFLGS